MRHTPFSAQYSIRWHYSDFIGACTVETNLRFSCTYTVAQTSISIVRTNLSTALRISRFESAAMPVLRFLLSTFGAIGVHFTILFMWFDMTATPSQIKIRSPVRQLIGAASRWAGRSSNPTWLAKSLKLLPFFQPWSSVVALNVRKVAGCGTKSADQWYAVCLVEKAFRVL